jgi:hypothetical protein
MVIAQQWETEPGLQAVWRVFCLLREIACWRSLRSFGRSWLARSADRFQCWIDGPPAQLALLLDRHQTVTFMH